MPITHQAPGPAAPRAVQALTRLICCGALASTLAGCATWDKLNEAPSMVDVMNRRAARDNPQPLVPTRPFDERATRSAMEPGDATLEGVLFSRANERGYDALIFDNANPIRPAKKQKVYLYPLTPYAVETINLIKKTRASNDPQKPEVKPDKGFRTYSRVTETDNYGRFSFTRLKPGRYFISAESSLQGEQNVEVEKGYTKHPGYETSVHYATETRTWNRPVVCEMAVELKPGERNKKIDARLYTHPNEWAKPLPDTGG